MTYMGICTSHVSNLSLLLVVYCRKFNLEWKKWNLKTNKPKWQRHDRVVSRVSLYSWSCQCLIGFRSYLYGDVCVLSMFLLVEAWPVLQWSKEKTVSSCALPCLSAHCLPGTAHLFPSIWVWLVVVEATGLCNKNMAACNLFTYWPLTLTLPPSDCYWNGRQSVVHLVFTPFIITVGMSRCLDWIIVIVYHHSITVYCDRSDHPFCIFIFLKRCYKIWSHILCILPYWLTLIYTHFQCTFNHIHLFLGFLIYLFASHVYV